MDLSKVKLVVSDMDGTLLNSNYEVSEEFYKLFKEFKGKDLTFVAASGRQYQSMVDKLNAVKDDIFIIAENGGITKFKDETLHIEAFNFEVVKEIIPILRKIEDVLIVLCSEDNAFIETRNEEFLAFFKKYYTKYEIVEDLTELKNVEILKVAVRHMESSEAFIYPFLTELHSNKEILLKISGKHWLDISSVKCNKGNALQKLQKRLNITEEETMVFGDYNNDLEMLQRAFFSYAMANAHPNVIETARFSTKSNDENGVEYILEQLVNAKTNIL